MNAALQKFARQEILSGLNKLPPDCQKTFKLMYCRDGGKVSVEDAIKVTNETAVAGLKEHQLDWALQQIENSFRHPQQEEEVDKYGNPISGDRLIYCCFPDCGCDGARLCMAEQGASETAQTCNVEGMWSNGSDPKCRAAVFKLVGICHTKKP